MSIRKPPYDIEEKRLRARTRAAVESIGHHLAEASILGDCELWEEIAAKINDCLLIYRGYPEPRRPGPAEPDCASSF